MLGEGKQRAVACGVCSACTAEDCRQCSACLDMIKYGGPGTKRRPCIQRVCQNKVPPGEARPVPRVEMRVEPSGEPHGAVLPCGSPAPSEGGEQTRASNVGYDTCNKNFGFHFTEDGRKLKITLGAKVRDPDELARIMILLVKRCEQGATHVELMQYRNELCMLDTAGLEAVEKTDPDQLAVRFADGALAIVGEKYALAKPPPKVKEKKEKPEKEQKEKKERSRSGGISYEACNNIFLFVLKLPDCKPKKFTTTLKKGMLRAKREVVLLAIKCNEGASIEELSSYKDQVLKLDDASLEQSFEQALAALGIAADDMFTEGTLARAEANHLGEGEQSTKRKAAEGSEPPTGVPATSDKKRHSKKPRTDKDKHGEDRVKQAERKGELEHALVIKGRDSSKKHSVVNGVYAPILDGFDGAKAFRNISVDASRVIYYHATKGRWKIGEELGSSKFFAYLADPNGNPDGKGVPVNANDPSRAWYFFNGKEEGYMQDAAVQCSHWKQQAPSTKAPSKPDQKDMKVAAVAPVPAEADSGADSSDSGSKSASDDEASSGSGSSDSSKGQEDPAPVVVVPRPKGSVCAKMLVTSGLRCACHFTYVRECPARSG